MSQILNQFNNDIHTREEVIDFIHEFIDTEALRKVYLKEDVSAVAEARELIDLAFSELDNIYGIRKQIAKKENQSK